MALTIPAVNKIPHIDRQLIVIVAKSKTISDLIPLGYSYWQAITSLERLVESGFINKSGRQYLLSESGEALFRALVAHDKRPKLRALEEFRIATPSRNDKVQLGRRTISQIRGRVSS